MAIIRINELPLENSPTPSEFLAIDGATTRKSTIQTVVDSGSPIASQALAEAGSDNNARMTPLSTKQAIDFNSVPLARTVTAGSGLSGGGSLSANISIALSASSLSSLALANTAVQPSRQIIAGTGISGGGALSADVTLNLSAATQTSLGLANTAIQDGSNALIPNGGTLGQVLVKNSNTNRDTGWATVAAATAVSYSSQSLTAAQQLQARINISSALFGHIYGMTLSNNATDLVNDIDISVGECASTESSPVLMVLPSILTKRLDASWAVGSGNGGRDTGAISDGTWHVWVIQRSDTGVVDALFSLSATSPTMPTSYDRKRRVGSVIRSSGSIRPFIQNNDYFEHATRISDVSATDPGTAAVTRALTVPTGISVFACGKAVIVITSSSGSNTRFLLLTSLSQPDADPATVGGTVAISTPAVPSATLHRAQGDFMTQTNTIGQIRSRMNISESVLNIQIITTGWIDFRGRF